MTNGKRLCFLTPDASYPLGEAEWRAQAEALAAMFGERGVEVVLEPWSGEADLAEYALVVPLMAWGYHRQLDHWYAQLERWVAAGVRLINPPDVLRWNSDKSYLLDFQAKGVAIIPSLVTEASDDRAVIEARARFGTKRLVIKPVSSAGSDGTFLLGPDDGVPAEIAGQRMLIQPMMPAIAEEGELSLFCLGGRYSHAIVKRPKSGDFRVQPQFGGSFEGFDPSPSARSLADAAMAAAGPHIAYARIDMVSDGAGDYRLMEIELIEPYLFLDRAPDGGRGFVEMVLAEVGVTRPA